MHDELCDLISHKNRVQANQNLEHVCQAFSLHGYDFMAVLEDGKVLGLCSRRDLGMLLGTKYGFSLFASKPVQGHLLPNPFAVKIGTPISEVFTAVFTREEDTFYDDVILLGRQGQFLGLIATQTLIKLQNHHHLENIQLLKRQSLEIQLKNEQIEEDLRLSRELQQALLPVSYPVFLPRTPHGLSPFVFHHYYRPYSLVGGDFFHVVKLADRTAGVFIADVMGHGVRSALVTAMLRAMLGELTEQEFENPSCLMAHVNRELCKILSQVQKTALFATALYVLVDAENQCFRYASAGHPLPIHVRSHGFASSIEHREPGTLLGVFDKAEFVAAKATYEPGDSLVLFTDGMSEVTNPEGEEFGLARLCETLASSCDRPIQEAFAGLITQAESFAGLAGFTDDICLLGIELA